MTAGRRLTVVLGLALALSGCAELTAYRDQEAMRAAELAAQPVGTPEPGEDIEGAHAAEAERHALGAVVAPAPRTTERIPGSGDFVAAPASVLGAGAGSREGEITLNFVNADVREVVRSVLGDTLGENYILDPRVQGTITVQTSRPLPRGALLPMLEEILALNGFALVRNTNNFVVLPMQEAVNSAGVSGGFLPGGGVGRGFAIRILVLAHVGAAEMAEIIEPMTPTGGVLRVDTARNLLIVAGTQHELRALTELVGIFDVDWMAGMSFALVPLDYADAETVIGELESIFGGADSGPLSGLLRFVAVERINAVLVIASRPHYLDQAEEWIGRLDQGASASEERRLFVYYVRNARAADLAAVLQEAFSAPAAAIPEAQLAPGAARAEIGVAPARRPVSEPAAAAGAEVAPGAIDEAAAVAGLGAVARAAASGGSGIRLVGELNIRIIADDANNALVILATAPQYRMIENALRKLDIVPLQVLIEATIAEVTLTDDLRYGVEWFFRSGNSSATLSSLATGVVAQSFPGPGGFSYLLTAGTDARVILNALESITDVNIISSPHLMVLDNQTAELQVGSDVPVATQQQQASATGDAPLVNTIEFRETGIILRVTPRVNPGGLVIMEIEQEVSSVVSGAGTVIPTFQQRRIKSTIAVQSGETVALGGLIQDNRNRAKAGVPFLQDIPLIGELFSNTVDTDTRTELLVVITPRVVGNPEEARAVTEELRAKMRAVVPSSPQIQDRTIRLVPPDSAAP